MSSFMFQNLLRGLKSSHSKIVIGDTQMTISLLQMTSLESKCRSSSKRPLGFHQILQVPFSPTPETKANNNFIDQISQVSF